MSKFLNFAILVFELIFLYLNNYLSLFIGHLVLFCLFLQTGNAQCDSQAKFFLPNTLCLGNSLNIIDSSYGLISQEWDFYANDLASGITGSPISLGGAGFINNSNGFSLEKTDSFYYGFAVNGTSKTITRVSFIDSLTNPAPIFEDLLITPPLASCLSALRFYKNTGFIGDGSNRLIQINFGNGIANQPTNSTTYTNSALEEFSNPRNLRIIEDNDSIFVIVANTGSKKHLSILTFGDSIGNPLTLIRKVDSLNTTNSNQRYAF